MNELEKIKEMSKEQDIQIDLLNTTVKAKIAPSKIDGVGVFAIRDITKGERIYADQLPKVFNVPYGSLGKLFPEVKEIILARWPNIINGSKFISPDARLLSFMNHSIHPNYNTKDDTALKNIAKGEEITEDYFVMENVEKVFPWIVKK